MSTGIGSDHAPRRKGGRLVGALALATIGGVLTWALLWAFYFRHSGTRDYFAEFSSTFPVRDDRILSRFGYYGPEQRQMRATFHHRYILTLQQNTHGPESRAFPFLHLAEIAEIATLPDGRISIRYGESCMLSEQQWNDLVRTHGDFHQIGVDLKMLEPVQGFDEHWLDG